MSGSSVPSLDKVDVNYVDFFVLSILCWCILTVALVSLFCSSLLSFGHQFLVQHW